MNKGVIMLIKLNTNLTCGCCGDGFRTWEGYQDQDQDSGYGLCKSCQGWIAEGNKREMDKCIKLIQDALNKKNQAKFKKMDREKQEYMVFKALDDGILTFGFAKARR